MEAGDVISTTQKHQCYKTIIALLDSRINYYRTISKVNEISANGLFQGNSGNVDENLSQIQLTKSELSSLEDAYRYILNTIQYMQDETVSKDVLDNVMKKHKKMVEQKKSFGCNEIELEKPRMVFLKTMDKYRLHLQNNLEKAQEMDNSKCADAKQVVRVQNTLRKINVTRTMISMLISSFCETQNAPEGMDRFRTSFLRDLRLEDFMDTWDVGYN